MPDEIIILFDEEVSLQENIVSKTFQIDFVQKISDSQKFEGLTHFETTNDTVKFFLCEDNDSNTTTTIIYELELVLN